MAVVVMAMVACGGEEAAPTAPASGVAPPGSAPTAPATAPTPASAPAAGSVPGTCYIIGEMVTDCPERSPHTWQPGVQIPGEYWGYHEYNGPSPTRFYESPMSYELVKEGKIPPLMERLPIPEDVKIIQGPDGIGEYGGSYRLTAHFLFIGEFSLGNWYERDSNGVTWHPHVGKSFQISADGRVYTFYLRRGMKWSDGTPFTMDDIRFAWEDLNYNKELNPTVSVEYMDLVTGNRAKFAVVDDHTWKMTFDTPVFNVMELRSNRGANCAGGGDFCFFAHKYMRQFHPKYADSDALQLAIDFNGVEDWVQLWKLKTNWETNPEKPCVRAWCIETNSDFERTAIRNHYFFAVDPEGNQMPYMDKVTMIKMESRPVSVFRAMAGENDGQTTPFTIPEVPLYLANMVKGDYSVYHWPSNGGNDFGLTFNITYNRDPEIGKWIRTEDFRHALSHATDRDGINEGVLLGVGTPQNWVPHPSTPYYPGPEYATLYTKYDPDLANQILDGLGLTEKDDQGYRLRTDGSDRRLKLEIQQAVEVSGAATISVSELVGDKWREIGIEMEINMGMMTQLSIRSAKTYFGYSAAAYMANPWATPGGSLAPISAYSNVASQIGLWVETLGDEGMSPEPDPSFLPLAPKGNFPADPSGNQMRLLKLWQQGREHPQYSPERIAIGKEIFTINDQQQWVIATVGFTGDARGVFLNRNNVKNQATTHIRDHYGFTAWTYFFEDGIDNLNHPENRSKYSESVGFVGD